MAFITRRSSLVSPLRRTEPEHACETSGGVKTAQDATGAESGQRSGGKAERPEGYRPEGDPQYLTRTMPAEGNRLAGFLRPRPDPIAAAHARDLWPWQGTSGGKILQG